jgi:predicted nucleic acid-binding protein
MKHEFKFTGIIIEILDVTQTSKEKKVEFIVEEQVDKYPQSVKFYIYGDEKVDKFKKYNKVGANVEISFNFKTNYVVATDTHYTSIEAWNVFKPKEVSAVPF